MHDSLGSHVKGGIWGLQQIIPSYHDTPESWKERPAFSTRSSFTKKRKDTGVGEILDPDSVLIRSELTEITNHVGQHFLPLVSPKWQLASHPWCMDCPASPPHFPIIGSTTWMVSLYIFPSTMRMLPNRSFIEFYSLQYVADEIFT